MASSSSPVRSERGQVPNSVVLHLGDAQTVLRRLPDGSVDACVTSPPYWGLRDYGVPVTVWGGDPTCSHLWGNWERGRRKDLFRLTART